ncbi:MAG: hypothetical protein AAGF11_27795 [Myxococcota bacterium]
MPLSITPIDDRRIEHGEIFEEQLVVQDARGPVTWSLRNAPDSMTIDPASGAIRWPAVYTGETVEIKARAKDGKRSASMTFNIDVDPVKPNIWELGELTVNDGAPLEVTPRLLEGTGDMFWAATGPDGLTINHTTGEMTWTAVWAATPYQSIVQVHGPPRPRPPQGKPDHWIDTNIFWIRVIPLRPMIVPIRPALVDAGTRFEVTPQLARGTGPIVWTLEAGPNGMQIDRGTGALSWMAVASAQPVTVTIKASGPGGESLTEFLLTVASPPALAAIDDIRITEGQDLRTVIELTQGTGPIDFEVRGLPRGAHITFPKRTIAWRANLAASPATLRVKATGPTGAKAERSFTITVLPQDEGVVARCPERPQNQPQAPPPCCDFQLEMHCKHVVGTSANGDNHDLRAGTHGWTGFHGTPFAHVNPRHYTMKFPPTGEPMANEKPLARRTQNDHKKFIVGGDTQWPVYQVLAGRWQLADLVTSTIEHEARCRGERMYTVCFLPKGSSSASKAATWTELRSNATEAAEYGLLARAKAEFTNVPLVGEWDALVTYNPFRWRSLPRAQWDVVVADEAGAIVRRDDVPLRVVVEAYSDIRWEINATLSRSSATVQGAEVTALPGIDKEGYQAEYRQDPEDPDLPETVEADNGWVLTGTAKVAYDQYVQSFAVQLLDNLQNSMGFLKVVDSAADFLQKAMSFAPEVDGSMRMPSLCVALAAEPYEQEDMALVGYQWKLNLSAKPLFGVQLEVNLLNMLLMAFPATAGAVPVLKALKYGVGIKGIARVQADFGVYLVAGGEITMDFEYEYQQPNGHAGYGLADARIDFKIEGRIEGEIEVLVVSAGAGVRLGAKTALGMCLKATVSEDSRPALQGQTRWEGIVLYMLTYYKAGLKIGPFTKEKSRTKSKVLVVAKPRYWPKAPAQQ